MRDMLQAQAKAKLLNLTNCFFIQADAETAELPAKAYDAVFCSSAMLYMQDIPPVISRIHYWLKPGGSLYFNTPQVPPLAS